MEPRTITTRLVACLNAYFFSAARLPNLGILRILLVFSSIDFDYQRFFAGKVLAQDASLRVLHEQSFITAFLSDALLFFNPSAFLFAIIYYVAAFCSCIGLFTRPALLVFGLLTLWLEGIGTAYGIFDHTTSLISQVILVLALAPGAATISGDRLFSWMLKRRKGDRSSLWQWMQGPLVPVWGLRLVLILLASVYFAAGVAKLRYGGPQWLDGKTLTHYLDGSANFYRSEGPPPIFISDKQVSAPEKWKDGFGLYSYSYGNRQASHVGRQIGHFLAGQWYLMVALSLLTLVFELGSIGILVDGWPRTMLLWGALIMHFSIGILLFLPFYPFRILCFFLVDWPWVYRQLTAFLKGKISSRLVCLEGFLQVGSRS